MIGLIYRCRCGWEGEDWELASREEFAGNREEPPEYSDWCPDCGRSVEEMDEIDPETGDPIEY